MRRQTDDTNEKRLAENETEDPLMDWKEYYRMLESCREEMEEEMREMEKWELEAKRIASSFYVR
jgi:hypothetical protein